MRGILALCFLGVTGVASAQSLEVSGLCPGESTFFVEGLAPAGSYVYVYGAELGPSLIPAGPCRDVDTGILDFGHTTPRFADATGSAMMTLFMADRFCGHHVRILSLDGCALSEIRTVGEDPDTDGDGDGWTLGEGDCDDTDASVHPDATEVCDGVDNDCDGTPDLGVCPCDVEVLGGHPYQVCTDDVTWEEAREHCASTGYHLATIDSAAENVALSGRLEDYGLSTSYWIGYNDLDVEGDWVWEDGSPNRYENWNLATGEPNGGEGENCGMVYVRLYDWHGRWNDESCTSGKRYVCEYRR